MSSADSVTPRNTRERCHTGNNVTARNRVATLKRRADEEKTQRKLTVNQVDSGAVIFRSHLTVLGSAVAQWEVRDDTMTCRKWSDVQEELLVFGAVCLHAKPGQHNLQLILKDDDSKTSFVRFLLHVQT